MKYVIKSKPFRKGFKSVFRKPRIKMGDAERESKKKDREESGDEPRNVERMKELSERRREENTPPVL